MKIAITGSSGFVGQNLLTYFNCEDILTVTRKQLNNLSSTFLNDCDAIVHLAGKAHDLKKTSNPDEYYQVNYELTKKLYDAFLKSNAKKFIFISSVKAAADKLDGTLTEDHISDPKTDYGKSKLMAEEYIKSIPLPEGKSFYILRPCMIHGPGNKGNLNLLYKFVKSGIPYPLAAFNNRRSFLSIENLCFVIKKLLLDNIATGIYNVADDEAISTNRVIQILADAGGKRAQLINVPKVFIRSIAKVGDGLGLPLNTERLQKLTESFEVSNGKIKSALNCDLPVETEEGLMRTARSFI